MSRLDELQREFEERHKDADLIECIDGKMMSATYFSPQYKVFEPRRWGNGNYGMEQKEPQVSPGVDAPVEGERR